MPSCGQDGAVLRAGGPVRDVQRPDQAADGEPGGGVLVEVERGLLVPAQLSALLPLARAGSRPPGTVGRRARPEDGSPMRRGLSRTPRNGARRSGRPTYGGVTTAPVSIDSSRRVARPVRRPGCRPARRSAAPRSRWTSATTWRCSTSTASSTSARDAVPGAPDHLAAARARRDAARVHHQQRRPPARGGGRAPARARRRGRRTTTWSPRPRRRRGSWSTGSARAAGSSCWGPRGWSEALVEAGPGAGRAWTTTPTRW